MAVQGDPARQGHDALPRADAGTGGGDYGLPSLGGMAQPRTGDSGVKQLVR